MHAYLIIGHEPISKEEELLNKLNGKKFEFPILKIEDVRTLGNFLKHTQDENTIIVSRDVDEATTEALNAFLKNLEEPQKNVSFILTAKNEYKILPTIISRCQVIRVKGERVKVKSDSSDFLDLSVGEKLLVVNKIKGRPDAVEFIQNVINTVHYRLSSKTDNLVRTVRWLEETQCTLNNLNANGNVNLQLTALIVNLNSPVQSGLNSSN